MFDLVVLVTACVLTALALLGWAVRLLLHDPGSD